MTEKYKPILPNINFFLHGADYNPEQWMDTPEIWQEDMRLMKLAHCNVMNVGIFAWSALEPQEGVYDFSWLDEIMDNLHKNGGYAVLATPSGARPAWMAQKYPEVLRTDGNRVRRLFGERHNHCYTSPIYREKTQAINRLLAERYKDHPALVAWHISNEFSGECHCELCQQAFRAWLKERYGNDLDRLNHAWWSSFWSHRYTDWDQIESPAPHGEQTMHGLVIDWNRFVTHQTVEFIKNEAAPLKEVTPQVPVTTNLMGVYPDLNYWELQKALDIISWDNYPEWHSEISGYDVAVEAAFQHDFHRSLKGRPFMLMESTPSLVNWKDVNKLKRPGMHALSSIQAVAHGADTVEYFQWRKSRGSSEKFHGAVVDHCGHEHTRVFRDVAELGKLLEKLGGVIGTENPSQVAIIYDWENRWGLKELQGLRKDKRDYEALCRKHYRAFWRQGICCDIIDSMQDFSKYRLVVAPMLYMVRPGVAERFEAFVQSGGTVVFTYWSGIVDENDLCFLGGFPGPLRKLTGIWAEEIDSLYDHDHNSVSVVDGCGLYLKKQYQTGCYCELIHAETAQVLATYDGDFYAGMPAVTVNSFGAGQAYYLAFRNDEDFCDDFYRGLAGKLGLAPAVDADLPEGVSAQKRVNGTEEYVFLMNFDSQRRDVIIKNGVYQDVGSQAPVSGRVKLDGYGFQILKRERQ